MNGRERGVGALAEPALRSKRGHPFDVLGDVAQNDGASGHQTRHKDLLWQLYTVLRRVYGAAVAYEPQDYRGYSTTRPDLTLRWDGVLRVYDVKLFCPLGSDPAAVGLRGAAVAFGNTAPVARAKVLGRAERGVPSASGHSTFDPTTGEGYVSPVPGDYAKALEAGCDVKVALAETFGGFSPDLAALLHEAAELVQDRLVQGEWDVNSWSATRWLPYAAQRVSVALHKAVAYELLEAVGLASVPVCVRVPT